MLFEKYPLQWPLGFPRTKWPNRSRFGNVSFAKARDHVFHELGLMLNYQERKTIILSTNIPLKNDGMPYATYKTPDDKGIAIYFQYKEQNIVICCDAWDRVEHNLWSVAKTIEAMRGIERWGVSDFLKHSFSGFQALPPASNGQSKKRDWWVVFNYNSRPGTAPWDLAGVQVQYKSLAKLRHPDVDGGSVEAFQELNTAYEEAKKYFNI
jgi:hypothetical protein